MVNGALGDEQRIGHRLPSVRTDTSDSRSLGPDIWHPCGLATLVDSCGFVGVSALRMLAAARHRSRRRISLAARHRPLRRSLAPDLTTDYSICPARSPTQPPLAARSLARRRQPLPCPV